MQDDAAEVEILRGLLADLRDALAARSSAAGAASDAHLLQCCTALGLVTHPRRDEDHGRCVRALVAHGGVELLISALVVALEDGGGDAPSAGGELAASCLALLLSLTEGVVGTSQGYTSTAANELAMRASQCGLMEVVDAAMALHPQTCAISGVSLLQQLIEAQERLLVSRRTPKSLVAVVHALSPPNDARRRVAARL